ncbi:hypothetical protein GCM10010096_34650 [Alcaligenes pakistanensis]|uniref:HEPN domain-containing protein n=1 Tax=Alcaligenes pakistanensis TaxID=1482717 RepID=A0A8H9M947_9BURK|nr:hypothetical protein GCM10010096_34650 [Alcaligenes pakistanensis]
MSVTPREILGLSERLCASHECEATLRASVSRAYYAAYHTAEDFHHSLDLPGAEPPERRGMHATLIYQLGNPRITDTELKKDSKIHSYILKTLKLARVEADYNLSAKVTLTAAQTQIESAKRLIDLGPQKPC